MLQGDRFAVIRFAVELERTAPVALTGVTVKKSEVSPPVHKVNRLLLALLNAKSMGSSNSVVS